MTVAMITNINKKSIGIWSSIILVFSLFTFSMAVKVNMSTADLGRHIKNGEIILNGTALERNAILYTNFYSYTENDFPFVNHHWLSGVVFYLTEKVFGFNGLSIMYLFFSLATLFIFFTLAREKSNVFIALAITLLAIPIIASRAEIRPEVFTFFLCGVFLYICQKVYDGRISARYLFLLPILELIWVNLHTGFIFGPFIAGIYFINLIIKKRENKNLIKKFILILILITLATIINPSGIRGAMVPFTIFSNYGYRIVENQSILFLSRLGVGNALAFIQYKILLGITVLSFVLIINRRFKEIDISQIIFTITFAIMAFMAIRYFPLFGFFAIPVVAFSFYKSYESFEEKIFNIEKNIIAKIFVISLLICGLFYTFQYINNNKNKLGIGPYSDSDSAANFFRKNMIKGPIFNNYDIGGYLIYHLYPEKVFFDNRPEAYSTDFIQNTYIVSLENKDLFKELDKKYNFNVIFFYYRDYTPWAQTFLTRIIYDNTWAPIFADYENLILIKRNKQNMDIIKKYEIPQGYFKIN